MIINLNLSGTSRSRMSADTIGSIQWILPGTGYLRTDGMEGNDPITIDDELSHVSGQCDT